MEINSLWKEGPCIERSNIDGSLRLCPLGILHEERIIYTDFLQSGSTIMFGSRHIVHDCNAPHRSYILMNEHTSVKYMKEEVDRGLASSRELISIYRGL